MPTLCQDLEEVHFISDNHRIQKKEGEKGLASFIRWLRDQADDYCSTGLCSTGTCKGHMKDVEVKLLKETDEYIDVEFSVKIFCGCDGGKKAAEDKSSNGSLESSPSTPGSSTDTSRFVCTQAEEDAEFKQMIALYSAAVNNARSNGYQAANDAGYSDPGLLFHKVGNCADWQQVSWASLVTRMWKCWKIQQIRARQEWHLLTFHHFVRIEAVCSGRVLFLDPWSSGNPDYWESTKFPFRDGNGWAHTVILTHDVGAAPRDPGND